MDQTSAATGKELFDNENQQGLLNNGPLPGNSQLERQRFLVMLVIH